MRNGGACQQVDTETNLHTHGLHMAPATAEHGGADACTFVSDDPTAPRLPWDNVFITVPASGMVEQMSCVDGETCTTSGNHQSFVYPLPPQSIASAFQPSAVVYPQWFGLQWYHPHMHEMSRDQLNRGLAGA